MIAQAILQNREHNLKRRLRTDYDYKIVCQVNKGCWWMPWQCMAKKDANLAKSFGEPEKGCDPEISEWGNPVGEMTHYFYLNT